jgi:hypothetical protein
MVANKSTIDKNHSSTGVLDEQPPHFKFLSVSELFNLPPRQMLIDRLLGVGELAMLYGESGKGKTFVTIDLLVSAITASHFANEFEIWEPLTVAYCAGEGTGALAERFKAAFACHGVSPAQADNLLIALDVPQLFSDGLGSIHQFVDDLKRAGRDSIHLLVIDTLHSATYGSNENSTLDAGQVLKAIKYAQKELGCAVLLVHHSNRAGTGERGSSAYRGAMDVILEVAGTGDGQVLKCSKMKDGAQFKPIAFSLVAKEDSARVFWEGFATESTSAKSGAKAQDKQALIDAMAQCGDSGIESNALAQAIGQTKGYTMNLLAELVASKACARQLRDSSKQWSNRNPWVYLVHSPVTHRSLTSE